MPNRSIFLILTMSLLIGACTLPGAASPTPFTFPTPNLTHTAIFAATPSETPPVPTLPAVEYTATPPLYTATPGIAATNTPLASPPTATPATAEPGTRPNGTPVRAIFFASPPTIDGDLSDWTSTGYTADEALPYASGGWSGPADLSATYYVGWDNAYLYLGVKRIDDVFVQISYGRYLYRGDDVEIQLDADLNGDFNSTVLSADDYQIGLSPGNFSSRLPEAYRWYPRSLEAWITSANVAAVRDGEGYVLEARIPWPVFGISPSAGASYGFALSLSDNDVPGTSSWQSMVSSVLSRKLADPTTWGTLTLIGSN